MLDLHHSVTSSSSSSYYPPLPRSTSLRVPRRATRRQHAPGFDHSECGNTRSSTRVSVLQEPVEQQGNAFEDLVRVCLC